MMVQISGEQDTELVGTAKIVVAYEGTENRAFFLRVPLLVSPFPARAAVEKPGFVLPPGETSSDPEMQGKLRSIYITADPNRPVEDESILPHSADDRKLVENAVDAALERVQLDGPQVARAYNVLCAEHGITCIRLQPEVAAPAPSPDVRRGHHRRAKILGAEKVAQSEISLLEFSYGMPFWPTPL